MNELSFYPLTRIIEINYRGHRSSAVVVLASQQKMDKVEIPELVIPEMKNDPAAILNEPSTILLGEDILDPDQQIDMLISRFKAEGDDALWLDRVKAFTHEEKVKWILSLPEPQRALGCMGYLVLVTVYLTVMVMVGVSATGDPIYEKRQVEKKVEKCMPKKP